MSESDSVNQGNGVQESMRTNEDEITIEYNDVNQNNCVNTDNAQN